MTEPFSVCSLGSGSKGNCLYVRGGDKAILLDAGLSAKATEDALHLLGTSLSGIDAIFITHEHSDHVRGLEIISKKHHIPVHMARPCAEHLFIGEQLASVLVSHPPLYSVTVGDMEISSFLAPHDSACCVGYRIVCGAHSLTAATDLGTLTTELAAHFIGSEAVVIEANHDVGLLRANPRYPDELKARILSSEGHLSNDLCARFVAYLAEHGTKYALLAHLSQDNNTPSLALSAVRARLTVPLVLYAAAEREIVRLM